VSNSVVLVAGFASVGCYDGEAFLLRVVGASLLLPDSLGSCKRQSLSKNPLKRALWEDPKI
jgi:hypothetical protein